MTARRLRLALGAIFLLGLGLRVLALFFEPPHHPDEFFQYLEPAWRHLTGAGIETWEWRRGIRSWALPGYHGAWMALFMRLGVRDGSTLGTMMRTHWALVSLTLVWAGWRGGLLLGRAHFPRLPRPTAGHAGDALPLGWQSGLLAALLCAAFPLLVRFSIHTLSELASILCMVWTLVLAGELVAGPPGQDRKAAWLGVLVGLGVSLRIQHAVVPVVIALHLLLARRERQLALTLAWSLLPVAAFGALDWLTWGQPFFSFAAYIKFNLLEGGASHFGALPASWYMDQLFRRLPFGLPVVGVVGLLGWRASWPFLLSALGLVSLLSTQAHKEERFVMLLWPLVLIPAAAYAGAWLAARPSPARPNEQAAGAAPSCLQVWLGRVLATLLVALVLGDGLLHCKGNDFPGLTRQRVVAHAWAADQPDTTGLIYDQPLFVGGYLWWGQPRPQILFKPALLDNPLFSHVLAARHSDEARFAQRKGFAVVYAAGDVVVLRRPNWRSRSAPAK